MLRTEMVRRLPFETDVMICNGSDILGLMTAEPFAGQPSAPNIVRFVIPLNLPRDGQWC